MIAALLCLVVAVADGDTLRAKCGRPGTFQQVTVRLGEIDAPEKRQPFGERSRQALAALCFGTIATIRPEKTDRYGRTVARVECGGKDASAEQVRLGMAWRFARYSRDLEVAALEASARESRRGLWVDDFPMAPWEWRGKRRAAPGDASR